MSVEKVENIFSSISIEGTVSTQEKFVEFYLEEQGVLPTMKTFRSWKSERFFLSLAKEKERMKERQKRALRDVSHSEMSAYLKLWIPWLKPDRGDVEFLDHFLTPSGVKKYKIEDIKVEEYSYSFQGTPIGVLSYETTPDWRVSWTFQVF